MNKETLIIIISLEGKESYTEVNFFQGINKFIIENITIFSMGLSKVKRTTPKEANNSKILNEIMPKLKKYDNTWIFFIADGDCKENIKAIKQAYKFAIIQIKQIKKDLKTQVLFHNDLLIPQNKKFEDELCFSPAKNQTNVQSFEKFCNNKEFFIKKSNQYIDWKKLMAYFQNKIYLPIFQKIYDMTIIK